MTTIRNVTAAEVATLKTELKKMGFKVGIKTGAPVKRVEGSIIITQRKHGDKWCFDAAEAGKLRAYLLKEGFVGGSIENSSYVDLCFCQGFHSIFKRA